MVGLFDPISTQTHLNGLEEVGRSSLGSRSPNAKADSFNTNREMPLGILPSTALDITNTAESSRTAASRVDEG